MFDQIEKFPHIVLHYIDLQTPNISSLQTPTYALLTPMLNINSWKKPNYFT
jgi:hypothetical protein